MSKDWSKKKMCHRIKHGRSVCDLSVRAVFIWSIKNDRKNPIGPVLMHRWELDEPHPKGTRPKLDNMLSLCVCFGCDMNWLTTGVGQGPVHPDKR